MLSKKTSLNRITPNFVWSSVILALWTAYVVIVFSPRPNIIFSHTVSTEIIDGRFVMFLLTRYFGLWSGLGVLLLRLLQIIKDNKSFIYIFVGLLNVSLGISGVYFYSIEYANTDLLHMFIVNLTIGLIIFTDIFFLDIILNNYQKE